MPPITTTRLVLLRAMYLFMTVGLLLVVWPVIFSPPDWIAGPTSVIRALLGALAVLCAVGIRYPVQMLPILLFELLWKTIWLLASALPMWLHGGLDPYAAETVFECLFGIVLVPIALPWPYVIARYVRAPAEPWRAQRIDPSTRSAPAV